MIKIREDIMVTENEDRRRSGREASEAIADIEDRMAKGDTRMTRFEKKLDENNKATAEVLEILKLGKTFFKLVGWIGFVAKWLAGFAAAVAAIYVAIKTK